MSAARLRAMRASTSLSIASGNWTPAAGRSGAASARGTAVGAARTIASRKNARDGATPGAVCGTAAGALFDGAEDAAADAAVGGCESGVVGAGGAAPGGCVVRTALCGAPGSGDGSCTSTMGIGRCGSTTPRFLTITAVEVKPVTCSSSDSPGLTPGGSRAGIVCPRNESRSVPFCGGSTMAESTSPTETWACSIGMSAPILSVASSIAACVLASWAAAAARGSNPDIGRSYAVKSIKCSPSPANSGVASSWAPSRRPCGV